MKRMIAVALLSLSMLFGGVVINDTPLSSEPAQAGYVYWCNSKNTHTHYWHKEIYVTIPLWHNNTKTVYRRMKYLDSGVWWRKPYLVHYDSVTKPRWSWCR